MKLREGVSTADIEYGIALLDEHSGEYWNLNPTGALALRTLLDGGTPDEAATRIVEEYAVDVDTAYQDVVDLVEQLRTARLVVQ